MRLYQLTNINIFKTLLILYIIIISLITIIVSVKNQLSYKHPVEIKLNSNSYLQPNQVDGDEDTIADSIENELIIKYAPVIIFDKNEIYFPINVKKLLENSTTKNNVVDIDNSIFKGSSPETWEIYSRVYLSKNNTIIIQYWILFAFNDPYIGSGFNHEGDWEHVTLELDQYNQPINIYYSNHGNNAPGEYYCWDDCINKSDSHPIVYVANGSHALFAKIENIGTNFNESTFIKGTQWQTWLGKIVNVGERPDYGMPLVDFISTKQKWGSTEKNIFKATVKSPLTISYQDGWSWNEKKLN